MSRHWFRAPSTESVVVRAAARAAAGRYTRPPIVDPSAGAATGESVAALWSAVTRSATAVPPDTGAGPVIDRETFAASPVVAGFEARARAELVLRALARETNLLLPSTRFLLLGTGPVADALAGSLTRLGARLEIVAHDPAGLADFAHRYGVPVAATSERVPAEIDVVIATGRDHPPFTPDAVAAAARPLVVIDAAPPDHPGIVLPAGESRGTVRNLTEFAGPRAVFVAPPPPPDALDRATADLRAVYAVLLVTVGPDRADEELAEVLPA
ncbi:MAG: hypothetical protein HOQ36_09900 [Nocardia sp.]|nr:hypothetical protein [Nocardia sp.]